MSIQKLLDYTIDSFLRTTRYNFDKPLRIHNDGTVTMGNLVEGKTAIIKSPTNQFEPFTVNYAETFIIPAGVVEYTIESKDIHEFSMIITAKVK